MWKKLFLGQEVPDDCEDWDVVTEDEVSFGMKVVSISGCLVFIAELARIIGG